MARKRRNNVRRRRGVVLLVVLSLLVLFVIVGLTFAVVASVYRRGAEMAASGAGQEEDTHDELDRAMYMMLRDTSYPTAIQNHSLLQDIYGGAGLVSTVRSVASRMGGELLQMELSQSAAGVPIDKFAGCVLTMTSGAAVHRSYRVVYSFDSGGAPAFVRLMLASARPETNGANPAATDSVLLSGRPFSGMGAGYDANDRDMTNEGDTRTSGTGGTDALARRLNSWSSAAASRSPYTGSDADVEALRGTPAYVGLMPNYGAYLTASPFGGGSDYRGLSGGLNEDWDAPDFNNMFLAWVPPVATAADEMIPSFHRPALVRYWFHWLRANKFIPDGISSLNDQWGMFLDPLNYSPSGGSFSVPDRQAVQDLKRRIILRPLAEDHPGFAASNPAFTLFGFGAGVDDKSNPSDPFPADRNAPPGPGRFAWDVDNDGDGRRDSIWIDPMFPVKKADDGRLYKTLIAPLIIDLDNRLDLSAHDRNDPGTLNHSSLSGAPPPRPFTNPTRTNRTGQGVGPAEISLQPLVGGAWTVAMRNNLLADRYGPDGQPGYSAPDSNPAVDERDDLLSYFSQRGMRDITINRYTGPGSRYRSVPDMFGVRLTAVDYGGNPIVSPAPVQVIDSLDDPYESQTLFSEMMMNEDEPFSPADLEGLLRIFDHDRLALSQRLLRYFDPPGGSPVAKAKRESLTTLSRHVPISSGGNSVNYLEATASTGSRLTPFPYPTTVTDLFRFRLEDGGVAAAAIETHIRRIVAPELRRGEPLDLNRPFGNMVDDNNNLVVDDILELMAGGTAVNAAPGHNVDGWAELGSTPAAASYGGTQVPSWNPNDDPFVDLTPPGINLVTPQQRMARHLFCLAMMLWENGYDIPFNQLNVPAPSGIGPRERELTVRRLAQWSVNAVDFRDPDAAMTVFEYDVNPWNGWGVDCDPRSNEGGERRIVIGLEKAEVALTEAVALHDVAARDTDKDETGKDMDDPNMPDDDPDQFRIPTASLFVEMLCVRGPSANNPPAANYGAYNAEMPPADLYGRALPGSPWLLNLGAVSPARSDMAYPIWRIAITHNHTAATAGDEIRSGPYRNYRQGFSHESLLRGNFHLDVISQGTKTPEESSAEIPFERFVWFANLDPQNSAVGAIRQGTFANLSGGSALLAPGQYAVVAPRGMTPIGSMDPFGDPAPMPAQAAPSMQQLRVAGGAFQATTIDPATGGSQTMVPGPNMRPVVGIVAERRRQRDSSGQAWMNTATRFSGLNITEELPNGAGEERVREPNRTNDPMLDPPDAYIDIPGNTTLPPPTNVDLPFYARQSSARRWILDDYDMDRIDSFANVRTACLQRLANPLLPWNPFPGEPHHDVNLQINPYVTVDWTSIDCTVFSGEEHAAKLPPDGAYRFGSSMRGVSRRADGASPENPAIHVSRLAPNTPVMRSPWWPATRETNGTSPVNFAGGSRRPYMKHRLVHTLGFLNAIDPTSPAVPLSSTNPAHVNSRRSGNAADPYRGYPSNAAFPWLKFNDRPYASAYELTQVPASSPGRLSMEFSVRHASDPSVVDFMNPDYTSGGSYLNDAIEPFGHLMNFHLGRRGTTTVRPNQYQRAPRGGSDLFRIFDFVHTPSRFVDTVRWLNPQRALNDNNVSFLNPPYNRLLEFREPGKINLNTLFLTHSTGSGPQSYPWNGLTHHFPDWSGTRVTALITSRQGFAAAPFYSNRMPYLPTRFANPFRSSMAARHMPPVVSAVAPKSAPSGPLVSLQRSDVDATLFRSRSDTPDSPLFHQAERLPTGATNSFDRNVGTDAAFAYEGLQRLANLTTNRSNCYAVWLTTGYFEVTPSSAGIDAGHLDGYVIGAELGTDTGEIQRHRAFYIIDRSIPVGFQAGRNHNVDKAVLLRRIIE